MSERTKSAWLLVKLALAGFLLVDVATTVAAQFSRPKPPPRAPMATPSPSNPGMQQPRQREYEEFLPTRLLAESGRWEEFTPRSGICFFARVYDGSKVGFITPDSGGRTVTSMVPFKGDGKKTFLYKVDTMWIKAEYFIAFGYWPDPDGSCPTPPPSPESVAKDQSEFSRFGGHTAYAPIGMWREIPLPDENYCGAIWADTIEPLIRIQRYASTGFGFSWIDEEEITKIVARGDRVEFRAYRVQSKGDTPRRYTSYVYNIKDSAGKCVRPPRPPHLP